MRELVHKLVRTSFYHAYYASKCMFHQLICIVLHVYRILVARFPPKNRTTVRPPAYPVVSANAGGAGLRGGPLQVRSGSFSGVAAASAPGPSCLFLATAGRFAREKRAAVLPRAVSSGCAGIAARNGKG